MTLEGLLISEITVGTRVEYTPKGHFATVCKVGTEDFDDDSKDFIVLRFDTNTLENGCTFKRFIWKNLRLVSKPNAKIHAPILAKKGF